MAALTDTNPTYLDVARRMDPNGSMARIVEIMSKRMPILEDVPAIEANDILSHRTTVRSGLPAGTWRRLNYGVPVEKTKTKQVTDSIGMLETYAEVDKKLADMNGNSAEWRLSEETGFIEGLSQTMASTLIYGNTDTDPEKFMGLAERYNDLSAENARMIVQSTTGSAGTDNQSIWGIVWGQGSNHSIYPKGSGGGLMHEDLGQETLEDGAGGYYEGYRSHYSWDNGMSVRDWRQACRVQVDLADLNASPAVDNLLDLMAEGFNQIQNPNADRGLVWYASRSLKTQLDIEAMNKSNMALSVQQQDNGGPVTMFWGHPIKHLEILLENTETAVA